MVYSAAADQPHIKRQIPTGFMPDNEAVAAAFTNTTGTLEPRQQLPEKVAALAATETDSAGEGDAKEAPLVLKSPKPQAPDDMGPKRIMVPKFDPSGFS